MADRMHPQTLTWWARSGNSGYGGITFAAPVTIYGRWEDKQIMFRDRFGDEILSNAVVYVDRDIEIGDYLIRGINAGTNPAIIAGAFEVKQFIKVPDLRHLTNERKTIL